MTIPTSHQGLTGNWFSRLLHRMSKPLTSNRDQGQISCLPGRKVGADLVLSAFLGRGAFSEVWSVSPSEQTEVLPLAAKCVRTTSLESTSEIDCWRQVPPHPLVVSLHSVVTDGSDSFLILDRVDGVELYKLIVDAWQDNGGVRGLPEADVARFFHQLCQAVLHVHAAGVAHRDIKTDNIIIDRTTNTVRLVDFGLATTERFSNEKIGSRQYQSPEMLAGKYNTQSQDVWGCGVVLYAMLTGQLPFNARQPWQLVRLIETGVYRTPTNISSEAKDLISQMLSVDASSRISLEEAMRHPFVARWTGSTSRV